MQWLMQVEHWINQHILNPVNGVLWNDILIFLLVGAGFWSTYKLGFAQLRYLREMVRLVGEGVGATTKHNHISSFQAFCVSTASRVGVGNIAGIAIAIVAGGPGAIFWMWFIALFGAATGIIESTLAQVYKEPAKGGGFLGGPAYYIAKGLKSKFFAVWFAILISITYGLIFNSVQANTIAASFGVWHIDPLYVGIALTLLSALAIFGGVKRIAKISEWIVPVMAGLYILTGIVLTLLNIEKLPGMLALIFKSAFTYQAAGGGFLGAAVLNGFKRGLFSNEAGMGSVPNAAGTADCTHPAKQGLIQGFGVFVDTMLVCTSTAMIVLISGDYTAGKVTGVALVQHNLATLLGSWAPYAMALFIFMFAFSSICGNYYYGEVNIAHMTGNKLWMFIFRLFCVAMVFIGSVASLNFVWDMADLFMALLVLTNVTAILLLGKKAFITLQDYFRQKKAGVHEPVFHASLLPGEQLDWWDSDEHILEPVYDQNDQAHNIRCR